MVNFSEESKKKYSRFLKILIILGTISTVIYYFFALTHSIPDTLNLRKNSVEKIDFSLPFIGTVNRSEDDEYVETAILSDRNNTIAVDLYQTMEIKTGEVSEYTFSFKLFGIIPIKKVNINVCDEQFVYPCGIPVGVYLNTDGVMVVNTGEVINTEGEAAFPCRDILLPGDYIIFVDGYRIENKEELLEKICEHDEESPTVNLTVRRDGKIRNVTVDAVMCSDGKSKIGAWVRDDCQGLGTLTYVQLDGSFGAFGHSVSDIDCGKIVEIKGGKLFNAKVWSYTKGKIGTPGELIGSIKYDELNFLGTISRNTNLGIYGTVDKKIYEYISQKTMEVGYKQDIKEGKAYVRSFIDGEIKDYEIQITKIDIGSDNNKGISFKVTDEKLLNLTGGIIQGMSGSPIIQDGKLIGAVTHVLVNDPTRGYGIFIENMLDAAE